jgi:ataxin-10
MTGSSSAQGTPTPTQQSTAGGLGFQYLKRDLVRLLGILCHRRKAVQDRVRECGGIEAVMNLCVVDERNPCKN